MHHFRFEVLLFIALMITWVHGQECGNVTLTANSGIFTSPNYPKEYDHKLNCNWTIMAPKGYFIQLSLKDFDLKNPFFDCSHDYIVVTTGPETSEKYCNDKRPNDTVLSRSNSMKVNLRTDNFFRNGLGFKAVYQVVDEDGNPINDEKEGETELKTVKPVVTEKTSPSPASTTTTTVAETKPVKDAKPAVDKKPDVGEPRKKPRKGGKKKKGKKSREERLREKKRRREQRKAQRKEKKAKGRKGRKKAKRASSEQRSA